MVHISNELSQIPQLRNIGMGIEVSVKIDRKFPDLTDTNAQYWGIVVSVLESSANSFNT